MQRPAGDSTSWNYEHAVEVEVSPAFAWSWWTDVSNWDDPPARFFLDGPFAAGSRGRTEIPGQEPVHWLIAAVAPPESATIHIELDRAIFAIFWRFEPLAAHRSKITQRIELRGENAAAYEEAGAMFQANLPDGMKKLAAAMAQAVIGRT